MITVCVGSIRGHTLSYLVDSILEQDYADWELIIAAQGSDPKLLAESERAQRRDPRIRSIHLETFGLSRARNAAIDQAHGDIVAFTDDDCQAAPNWLSTIHACFEARPEVGIVAGNLVPSQATRRGASTCPATYTIECVYVPADLDYCGPPGFYWAGANFAVRRTALDHIGLFDPYLGPGSEFPAAEDVDFGLRAEALNVPMWTTPTSIVHHTFGRRYGLNNVLKHYRTYALGSGALGAKLSLLNHPVLARWRTSRSPRQTAMAVLRNPARELFLLYRAWYLAQGSRAYLSNFEVGPDGLTQPRPRTTGSDQHSEPARVYG
jgi:glycosyltransferase involved in cell wall biosynthesis